MSDGLADTSCFIANESGRPLRAEAMPDRLAVSAVTIGELWAGVLAAADVDTRALVGALRGSWAGPLRWYGLVESADELRLAWALEDESVQLCVRIHSGELAIEAEVAQLADPAERREFLAELRARRARPAETR